MYVILAIRYGSHRGVCGIRIWGIAGYWSMGKQDERLWLTEEYDGQLECGTTTKGTSWQVSKQGHAHWVFGFVFSVKGCNLGVISSRWSVIVRVSVDRSRNFFGESDWRFDNLCGSHVQSESKLVVSRQLMVSNSGCWPVRSVKSRCYCFLVFKCALFRSQRLYMC